jgi:Fe-S-cluster containining protein
VQVSEAEMKPIAEYLQLSDGEFRKRHVRTLGDAQHSLIVEDDGKCIFFESGVGCRIYPVRPRQCHTYPFWPEVLATRTSWQKEATRCEGIGRGDVVSKIRIEEILKQQQE